MHPGLTLLPLHLVLTVSHSDYSPAPYLILFVIPFSLVSIILVL